MTSSLIDMDSLNQRQIEYLRRLTYDDLRTTADGYWWTDNNERVDMRTLNSLLGRGLASAKSYVKVGFLNFDVRLTADGQEVICILDSR